jgi:hypothetical protein
MADTATQPVETKAPAKKRRVVKTPTKTTTKTAAKTAAKKAPAEKKAAVNTHVEAGIEVQRYTGPSKFVNANRKPQIRLGVEAVAAKITDRQRQGLYALRDCYGGAAFAPRGFDNGILSMLIGAGLLSFTGGMQAVINGTSYQVDGDKPVRLKITAAGAAYGKA